MACTLTDLDIAPACLYYTSPTRQLQAELNLLAQAVSEVGGSFTDFSTLHTAALAQAACVPPGVAKAKAAEIIESGLAEVDITGLQCYSQQDLEIMRLYLICQLITVINP